MDKSRARVALLKISLLTLVITSWIFVSFLFSSRPEEAKSVQTPLTALVRLPASLPNQLPVELPTVFEAAPKVMGPVEMNVVKLPCWDKGSDARNSTSARWIRLTGKTCNGAVASEHIVVRNLSTGYVATIFPTGKYDLTTDFIPLREGKNEILIRMEPVPGAASENQVQFYRQ